MLSRPEAIPPHIEGKRYRYNPLSFSSSIEIPFSRVDIPLAEAEKRPLAPLKKTRDQTMKTIMIFFIIFQGVYLGNNKNIHYPSLSSVASMTPASNAG